MRAKRLWWNVSERWVGPSMAAAAVMVLASCDKGHQELGENLEDAKEEVREARQDVAEERQDLSEAESDLQRSQKEAREALAEETPLGSASTPEPPPESASLPANDQGVTPAPPAAVPNAAGNLPMTPEASPTP